MGAWFQGDMSNRTASRMAGAAERLGFGVGSPAGLCPATADYSAIVDEHATDGRVGPSAPKRPVGQPESCPHMIDIAFSRRRH